MSHSSYAEDEPGIAALERCRRRLHLREWLLKGVNFGTFPPFGSHIKRIPNIMFQGYGLTNIERRIQLFPNVKSGCYNVRALGSLDLDPKGSCVIKAEEIPASLEAACQMNHTRLAPDRLFHMSLSKANVYPMNQLLDDRGIDAAEPYLYPMSLNKIEIRWACGGTVPDMELNSTKVGAKSDENDQMSGEENKGFDDGVVVTYASDSSTERTATPATCPPTYDVVMNDDTVTADKPFLYNTSETPPIHILVFVGFQHALLGLSASLGCVLIAADVICAQDDEILKSQMLSSTLFMNGISTILMVTVGARLPLYQGAYGGYIIPLLTLMQIDPTRCTVERPDTAPNSTLLNTNAVPFDEEQAKKDLVLSHFAEVQGCLMIVGALHFLVGATGLVGVLLRYVGPVTIVPTILLLGIYVADPILNFVVPNWGIALLTCAIGIILAFYLSKWQMPIPIWTKDKGCHIIRYPFHQIYAILISIILTWIISLIITEAGGFTDDKTDKGYQARTDARLDAIENAEWFFFPYPGMYGRPSFSSAVLVGFLIATFISILDSIGDYYACAATCRVPPPPSYAVNRGIAVEGFCTVLSGAVGCPQATTTYGANIGAIGITRVASRSVFIVVGVIYIVFGVIGKISAVFVTIPYPVLGGALIIMMGMFNGVVLSNLVPVDLNSPRNLVILGVSILMGLLVPLWVKKFPDDINTGNEDADFVLKGLLGNPNFTGAMLACFLDNTIPGTLEERGIAAWQNKDDVTTDTKIAYVEGVEIYETWLPKFVKNWKGLKYIPFLPSKMRNSYRMK